MDYGYKPTTTGRTILAACLATQTPLTLTRVAIGCGSVPEGTNLADVHEPISYVADGTIGAIEHKDDRLYLTVQYENNSNPDVGKFDLSEFVVYAIHPETGEEADLLYATLGKYKQPVVAYNANLPPSVWKFPLVLVLSDEVEVAIDGTLGLATHGDLMEAFAQSGGIKKKIEFSISVDSWIEDPEKINGYGFFYDLSNVSITKNHVPRVIFAEESVESTVMAGICATASSFDGYVRIKAVARPEVDIYATCYLELIASSSIVFGSTMITGNYEISSDEEVQSAIDEIFDGETMESPDSNVSPAGEIATDEEVKEVIETIFGQQP